MFLNSRNWIRSHSKSGGSRIEACRYNLILLLSGLECFMHPCTFLCNQTGLTSFSILKKRCLLLTRPVARMSSARTLPWLTPHCLQPVHCLSSGRLSDLQQTLAWAASTNDGKNDCDLSCTVDLCGCTFSGSLNGSLLLSNVVLSNGTIEVPPGCLVRAHEDT